MNCGKLEGDSCVTDDECTYSLCIDGECHIINISIISLTNSLITFRSFSGDLELYAVAGFVLESYSPILASFHLTIHSLNHYIIFCRVLNHMVFILNICKNYTCLSFLINSVLA
ncbi:hypothetical protein U3516DRAFT_769029 [Neocallimastix sp. 'constans']